jgi:hypothetical protein
MEKILKIIKSSELYYTASKSFDSDSLDEMVEELVNKIELELKPKKKEKPKINEAELISKAFSLLKDLKVEFPVVLYRFGTYRQYELAGQKVDMDMFEDLYDEICNKHNLNDIDDNSEIAEKFYTLEKTLSFINSKYLSKKYDMYGQNTLELTENGDLVQGRF